MRETYWFLTIFTFFILAGLFFVAIPILFIALALGFGALAFYFQFSSGIADGLMVVGLYPWGHWLLFLILTIVLTAAFLLLTIKARKTATYKKIRLEK